jgi:porin
LSVEGPMRGIGGAGNIRSIRVFAAIGALLLGSFISESCRSQTNLPLTDHSFATQESGGSSDRDKTSGAPPELKERGVELHLEYTGEAFHGFGVVPDGATEYRGLLELEASLDTGKAGLWPGGKLFVKGQNGHGEGFIVDPGGISLFLSDIGAPDFTQMSEYGLKQKLMDGDVTVILGKQNANDYFSVNQVGQSFILPAYTLIPTVPMPTYPAYALGTSLFVEPAEWLSLGMGVYDGAPEIGSLGFNTLFEGRGGVFTLMELTCKPKSGRWGEPDGHYSVGVWYHNGNFVNTQNNSSSDTLSGNYGWYLMLDRLLFRERGIKSGDQGLGCFFQFGWAPEDRNSVTKYVGAGLTYKGLFAGRDKDELGIGLSHTWLIAKEPVSGVSTKLTNLELFYKVQVNSWMSLQPDIQYYNNPGEDRNRGLAPGIRWVINY